MNFTGNNVDIEDFKEYERLVRSTMKEYDIHLLGEENWVLGFYIYMAVFILVIGSVVAYFTNQ